MDVQWPLVFFTLLTGLGVGAFSCVAVIELLGIALSLRLYGAVTALVAMALGSGFSFLHLSHPFRTVHIPKHLDTGVGKEMLLIGLTGIFVFLYILIPGAGSWGWARKVVAILGLVCSVLMAFEMGAIYVLPARPAWNTWFWPFIYAASAAATGLMAMTIWALVLGEGKAMVMGVNKGALIALIAFGGGILAYLIFLKEASYKEGQRSPARLLSGDLAVLFWAGVVLSGLVIPLGLSLYIGATKGGSSALAAGIIGLIDALIGGIAVRALMYRLGSEADPMLE